MSKNKLQKAKFYAIVLCSVLIFNFCLNISLETVYAEEVTMEEQQKVLKDVDMSNVEFYDSNIPYDEKMHYLEATNLPLNVKVLRYEGNGVWEEGKHEIWAYFIYCGDDVADYNPIPPKKAILTIVRGKDPNKLDYDESNIIFKDATITDNGKAHSISATGVPEGVEVYYTGNNRSVTGKVVAHFKGDDAHNPILDRTATLTIKDKEEKDSLGEGETGSSGTPEESTSPEEPTQPEEPTSPEEPTQPEEPTTPEEPTQPEKPTSPEGPTQPEKPTSPEEPTQPEEPTSPEEPTRPEEPTSPEEPTQPEKPTNPEEPTQPVEPTNPEQQHVWSEWSLKDYNEEERQCSHCGIKETRPHTVVLVEVTFFEEDEDNHVAKEKYTCTTCSLEYEDTHLEQHEYSSEEVFTSNHNGTHIVKITYVCPNCNRSYTEQKEEDCQYGDWQYVVKDNIDAMYCNGCNYVQTREHLHEEEPEELEYIYKSSNQNGTHQMESSYICKICNQTVTVNKDEDCDYELTYKQTGINDIHMEVRDCKVCQYHTEKQGDCVPEGELKCVKIYEQVYEGYECALCYRMCRRQYHTVHKFQDWEAKNDTTHIRYCICIEARETANHEYEYVEDGDTGTFTCEQCGYKKTVEKHNHGLGTYNDMDEVEMLVAFDEMVNYSPIAVPNPSPEKWCFYYEFRCNTCGIPYYVYHSHNFDENGICQNAFCGHIKNTEELIDKTSIFEYRKAKNIFDLDEPTQNDDENTTADKDEIVLQTRIFKNRCSR